MEPEAEVRDSGTSRGVRLDNVDARVCTRAVCVCVSVLAGSVPVCARMGVRVQGPCYKCVQSVATSPGKEARCGRTALGGVRRKERAEPPTVQAPHPGEMSA